MNPANLVLASGGDPCGADGRPRSARRRCPRGIAWALLPLCGLMTAGCKSPWTAAPWDTSAAAETGSGSVPAGGFTPPALAAQPPAAPTVGAPPAGGLAGPAAGLPAGNGPPVITPFPAQPRDQWMQGALDAEGAGEIERARSLYLMVLQQDPSNELANHRLGVISDLQGRFAESEAFYSAAYRSNPTNVMLMNDIAISQFLQGRFTQCEELLRRAAAIDPTEKTVARNLAAFDYARSAALGRPDDYNTALQLFQQMGSPGLAQAALAAYVPPAVASRMQTGTAVEATGRSPLESGSAGAATDNPELQKLLADIERGRQQLRQDPTYQVQQARRRAGMGEGTIAAPLPGGRPGASTTGSRRWPAYEGPDAFYPGARGADGPRNSDTLPAVAGAGRDPYRDHAAASADDRTGSGTEHAQPAGRSTRHDTAGANPTGSAWAADSWGSDPRYPENLAGDGRGVRPASADMPREASSVRQAEYEGDSRFDPRATGVRHAGGQGSPRGAAAESPWNNVPSPWEGAAAASSDAQRRAAELGMQSGAIFPYVDAPNRAAARDAYDDRTGANSPPGGFDSTAGAGSPDPRYDRAGAQYDRAPRGVERTAVADPLGRGSMSGAPGRNSSGLRGGPAAAEAGLRGGETTSKSSRPLPGGTGRSPYYSPGSAPFEEETGPRDARSTWPRTAGPASRSARSGNPLLREPMSRIGPRTGDARRAASELRREFDDFETGEGATSAPPGPGNAPRYREW